jgi:polysaccharide export outer membrane protein
MLSVISFFLVRRSKKSGFAPGGFCRTGNLLAGLLAPCLLVAGCANMPVLPQAVSTDLGSGPEYVIGPLDNLNIFVWRHPELTETVPVRPDGRISVPLIEDMTATGKTPTQLGTDLQTELTKYVQDPVVTVIVTGFNGPYDRQVRVIGEAAHPQAIPYRDNMSLLDAMIAVGGLTQFAAGNSASVIRRVNGKETEYRVRLSDLIQYGDIRANATLLPGDVIIIPQSWF